MDTTSQALFQVKKARTNPEISWSILDTLGQLLGRCFQDTRSPVRNSPSEKNLSYLLVNKKVQPLFQLDERTVFFLQTPTAVNKVKELVNSHQDCVSIAIPWVMCVIRMWLWHWVRCPIGVRKQTFFWLLARAESMNENLLASKLLV